MDAAAKLGKNPASKHQIQPEHGDEQADARRDCRTRLTRPNSQRERGQGRINFPCSADHEQDWQPYPVGPYPWLYVMTIHKQRPVCRAMIGLLYESNGTTRQAGSLQSTFTLMVSLGPTLSAGVCTISPLTLTVPSSTSLDHDGT